MEVRLTPRDPPGWIRPGQTFNLNILTGVPRQRLVVPASAISTMGGVSSLLAVENGRIVKKIVTIDALTDGGVPVLTGITAQTLVVMQPTGLTVGQAGQAVASQQ